MKLQTIRVQVEVYQSWAMYCPQCGHKTAINKIGGHVCVWCKIKIEYYLRVLIPVAPAKWKHVVGSQGK